jgi:ABC-type multidrug transport system permease subunit
MDNYNMFSVIVFIVFGFFSVFYGIKYNEGNEFYIFIGYLSFLTAMMGELIFKIKE